MLKKPGKQGNGGRKETKKEEEEEEGGGRSVGMMGMGREEARKKSETGVHVWVGWLVGYRRRTNDR